MSQPSELPAALLDRALRATGLSVTIADAQAPDRPLVWVNEAFTAMTGYTEAEVLGRNCRFLQGEATESTAVDRIRAGVEAARPTTTTVLNYRRDGTSFWNEMTTSPVHDADGVLTHFVGVQNDVSQARATMVRRALLGESINQLSATLDFDEARQRLVDLIVPAMADWVIVVNVDDRGEISEVVSTHKNPAKTEQVAELAADLPHRLNAGPVEQLLLAGQPVRRMLDIESPEMRAERMSFGPSESMLDRTAEIGARSCLLVSLPCRRRLNDVIIMVRDHDREQFDDDDVDLASTMGARAGLILDNARLFRTQQRIAETLQRSLLPDLPKVAGIEVAARYVAAGSGAEVGGDFYELIELPDGSLGLVVGDVLGHDVLAAAAMGHLKGVIRACAYDQGISASPATVLERVDSLVAGLGMPTIATAVFAHLRPVGEDWEMTYSNAGHPPFVVRLPDGSCELLSNVDGHNDLLLGVQPSPRTELRRLLPAGTTVIGYTDGLVERRDEPIDAGLDRMLGIAASGPVNVHDLVDHLVEELSVHNEDDVAVIALRLGQPL